MCAAEKSRGLRKAMSIKSDRWIRTQAVEHKMIEPFSEKQVRDGVISYGLVVVRIRPAGLE